MENMVLLENNSVMAVADSTGVSTWQVSEKRGNLSGIEVSVTGPGSWARMKGSFGFSLRSLEKSGTYKKMQKSYNISGGIHGFFSWLGFGSNAQTHKEEINETFNEISNSQDVNGTVDVDLYVTGIYPGFEVKASAYVFVLQITNQTGQSFTVISDGDPTGDVNAQDSNNNTNLPTKDNTSTITI